MGRARSVTVERVVNGFLVRWKRTPEWNHASQTLDPEERVHIWADLEIALQMLCDEISFPGEEMNVMLTERRCPEEEGNSMEHDQMRLLTLAGWPLVGLLMWVLLIGGVIHWVGALLGAR